MKGVNKELETNNQPMIKHCYDALNFVKSIAKAGLGVKRLFSLKSR